MSGTRITGASVGELRKAHRLYMLDLSKTAVDDAGLLRLVDERGRAIGFQILNLTNTRTTPAGIERYLSTAEYGGRISLDGKFGKGTRRSIF